MHTAPRAHTLPYAYEATQAMMVLHQFVSCALQKPLAKQLTNSTHREGNTWELQAHLCACGTLCSDGKRNLQVEREMYMV